MIIVHYYLIQRTYPNLRFKNFTVIFFEIIMIKNLPLCSLRQDFYKIRNCYSLLLYMIDLFIFFPSNSVMMLEIKTILMMGDVTDWLVNYCVVVAEILKVCLLVRASERVDDL